MALELTTLIWQSVQLYAAMIEILRLCVFGLLCSGVAADVLTVQDACHWLTHNGFLSGIDCDNAVSLDVIEEALRTMQEMHSIPVTGDLDQATLMQMNTAHCSRPELSTPVSVRRRRQASPFDNVGNPGKKTWLAPNVKMPLLLSFAPDFYWHKTNIVSQQEQRDLAMRAALAWGVETATLSFAWAPEGRRGNIEFTFAFIDGPKNSIGRAGDPSPESIDQRTHVRLDDVENWVKFYKPGQTDVYPMYWAFLHEMGHALGLPHSSDSQDIMYYSIQPRPATLGPGDIAAIQELYGAAPGREFNPNNPPVVPPLSQGSINNPRPIKSESERVFEATGNSPLVPVAPGVPPPRNGVIIKVAPQTRPRRRNIKRRRQSDDTETTTKPSRRRQRKRNQKRRNQRTDSNGTGNRRVDRLLRNLIRRNN